MNGKWNNVWVRSIFSLIMGVLLVVYPGVASLYFVQTLGVLFFIPGLVVLVSFFRKRKSEGGQSFFPIIGLGSFLFGLWLIISPISFVSILMYILGMVLVLAGISMITNLVLMSKKIKVALGFYFIPILVLIAGIVVLVKRFETAEIPFIVLGVSAIFYALSDMFNAYKFRHKEMEIPQEDSNMIDVLVNDENLQIEEKEQTPDEVSKS